MTHEQRKHVKLWVEALRSGDYEQTTGTLQRVADNPDDLLASGLCCLGVACEVYNKHAETPLETYVRDGIVHYEDPNGDAAEKVLYGSFTTESAPGKWLGLPGYVLDTGMYMNDNLQRSFDEIAAYMEGAAAVLFNESELGA